ncbi:MAG: SMC-Scp complex subunit ScpB, partial [Lacipirellulaceae bacterium]
MEEAQSPPAPKLSLARLSTAFAKLMSPAGEGRTAAETEEPSADPTRLSPKMLIESMLFVGDEHGKPLSAESLAGPIRDVSSDEIENLISELNDDYRQADSAYEVVSSRAGYRMQLRSEFDKLRNRFSGDVREAKLTPAALEVLSIVAYRQPVTGDQVSKLRGTKCHAILASLVRRNLLSLETLEPEPESSVRRKRQYVTTERFNKLFGVSSSSELPKAAD